MKECTLCGKESRKLVKIRLEGTTVDVCDKCSEFGDVIEPKRSKPKPKPILDNFDKNQKILIRDYGRIVKNARESRKLSREDFAKKIKERESIIRRIENQDMEPDNKLINKLEKSLKIDLMEEY